MSGGGRPPNHPASALPHTPVPASGAFPSCVAGEPVATRPCGFALSYKRRTTSPYCCGGHAARMSAGSALSASRRRFLHGGHISLGRILSFKQGLAAPRIEERRRSWGFTGEPFAVLILPRGRCQCFHRPLPHMPFPKRPPRSVFIEHRSSRNRVVTHESFPAEVTTDRGRLPRLLGFIPAGKLEPARQQPRPADTALGFGLSQV